MEMKQVFAVGRERTEEEKRRSISMATREPSSPRGRGCACWVT